MENEDEKKKADTQTATESTTANAENEETKVEEIENKDIEQAEENDEKVANAFGNKAVNKKEGEKGKKTNSVAKVNEDGSITFGSQEELNGFIARLHAEKAEEKEKAVGKKGDKIAEVEKKEEVPQSVEQENLETSSVANFTSDIALALIEADVNPKKAKRAVNLVKMENVVLNGKLDEVKLKEEIDAVIADFPELKIASQSQGEQGFKFGAGQQEQSDTGNDEISKIFGNKK